MLCAPLFMLALPMLLRERGHVAPVPLEKWLLWLMTGTFYLLSFGGGAALLVRSVWGVTWREVGVAARWLLGLAISAMLLGVMWAALFFAGMH